MQTRSLSRMSSQPKAMRLHRSFRWDSCVLPATGLFGEKLYGTTNPEQAIPVGGPGG